MVSVLFADLTGSTPLGERVDAEDLRNVLKVFFDSMSRQVLRYEGTIDKYVGDAVMAVFGAPVSHEDDAIRALNAALGMQRAVAALNVDLDLERTYGARLALRIGVSSGEVVAGRLGGESAAAYTVVGDTVNTAQRLQAAAAPGEIVVGETARRFAWHSFVFEELPPLMLKGKARPVPAYRVLGWRREGATPDAHALVGRSDELAHLRSALGELSRTTGRVVGIVGEAGVGKSRLVREFRASCTPGVNHLLGRCQSFETNTRMPWSPVWCAGYFISKLVRMNRPHAECWRADPAEQTTSARLQRKLGTVLRIQGAYDASAAAFGRGLSGLGSRDDLEAARIQVQIGQLLWRRGEYSAARQALETAVQIGLTLDGDDVVAEGLKHLGNVCQHAGDPKDAADYLARSLSMYERLQDLSGIADVRSNLGIAYGRMGRWDDCLRELRASLGLRERMGDSLGIGTIHNNLGELQRERGEYQLARQSFQNAIAIWQDIGYASGVANALVGLGATQIRLGDAAKGTDQLAGCCGTLFGSRKHALSARYVSLSRIRGACLGRPGRCTHRGSPLAGFCTARGCPAPGSSDAARTCRNRTSARPYGRSLRATRG